MVTSITFCYTNYRGEKSIRTVDILEVRHMVSPYHGDDQHWFLIAVDLDKRVIRSFKLADCDFTTTTLETQK